MFFIRSSLISSKIAGSSIVGGILYSTLSAIFLIVPLKILPDLVFGSLLITIAILNAAVGVRAAARIYNNGVPTNLVARHGISGTIKAYWKYGNTAGDTIAAVQDLGAADVDMAQGTASKQPVLITGANVRTGVN